MKKQIICSAIAMLAAATSLQSCKKNSNNGPVSVSYEQLGEQTVNAITGYAMNGDIIGRDGNNAPIRYRSANGTWEHIGSNTGLPNLFTLRCEDAAGNFYAQSLSYNADNWILPSGTSTWQHFVSPDADSIAVTAPYNSVPYANIKGELVVQTHTTKNGVEHARIYRKAAGSNSWVMASVSSTGHVYRVRF